MIEFSKIGTVPSGNDGIKLRRIDVVAGTADVLERRVWIDGDRVHAKYPHERKTKDWVAHTIAHEIGHIVISDGHPNALEGPAHFNGIGDFTERLMVSGFREWPPGIQLVKSEWDNAEIRLGVIVDNE